MAFHRRNQATSVAVGVFISLFGVSAFAQMSGTLTVAEGQVFVQSPGSAEKAAKAGQALEAGTRIRTSPQGSAEIRFEDGSLLKLRPGSQVQLSGNRRQKKKNSVVLFFGRVWSQVTKAVGAKESTFEVKTPNAVCGVRGTEFETAVADDGSVQVRVEGGKVAVEGDTKTREVDAGEQVAGDESGVDEVEPLDGTPQWEAWNEKKKERLRRSGKGIVDAIKSKIMSRKDKVAALGKQQETLKKQQSALQKRASAGDAAAQEELAEVNAQLAELADAIADLGDEAASQFGLVDHFADLANDPRFKMIDRKYLVAEAESLRRIQKMFDKMIAEGTDLSMKGMDDMMKDMRGGKKTLDDGPGSTKDDLFGPDDMDLR